MIEFETTTRLPTRYGDFNLLGYNDRVTGDYHLALVFGEVGNGPPPLVRLHSECLTGDALRSVRCDCGDQLDLAQRAIVAAGRGVVVYLRQEGRSIGLAAKLRAYALQDTGLDTVEANERLGFPADAREYAIAAQILLDLRIHSVRLLTNNPHKLRALEDCGVQVTERVPLLAPTEPRRTRYLSTKRAKLGHVLPDVPGGDEPEARLDHLPILG